MPVGVILMFIIAPTIADMWRFRSAFFMIAVLSLLAFICFAAVFVLPEGENGDIAADGTFFDGVRCLKTKNIWLLGALLFCFCGMSLAIANGYCNTFLEIARGFTAADSSFVTSLCALPGFLFGSSSDG